MIELKLMKNVEIYTDGACSGNPGVGGWAAILIYKNIEKEIYGSEEETTNNRMELTAVIEGLKLLKEKCNVTIYSDSAYVVNAINNNWLEGWVNNNWKKSSKESVANIDLWQQLILLLKKHPSTFVKVKGHSDNKYNNMCDKLAVSAIQNFKNGI